MNGWVGRFLLCSKCIGPKRTTAWPHCLRRITSNSPSVHPSSHTKAATHTLLLQFSVPVCPLWVSFQCLIFHLVRWQVGIILHYSSLSSMLWLLFTARNICKEVSKAPPIPQDRDPPTQARPKASILRYTAWMSMNSLKIENSNSELGLFFKKNQEYLGFLRISHVFQGCF